MGEHEDPPPPNTKVPRVILSIALICVDLFAMYEIHPLLGDFWFLSDSQVWGSKGILPTLRDSDAKKKNK